MADNRQNQFEHGTWQRRSIINDYDINKTNRLYENCSASSVKKEKIKKSPKRNRSFTEFILQPLVIAVAFLCCGIKDVWESFFVRFEKTGGKRTGIFNKITASTAVYAVVLVIICVVMFNCFDVGYAVSVGDKNLGIVRNSEVHKAALDDVNNELVGLFGENCALDYEYTLLPRVILKGKYTSDDELKENIRSLSDRMTVAFALNANGVDIAAFKTRQELDEALETFKKSYESDGTIQAEFTQLLSVEEKNVPVTMVRTAQQAQQYFAQTYLADSTYTATEDTTVEKVAKKFGISSATVRELNPGIKNNIEPGTTLAVKEYKNVLQVQTVSQVTYEDKIPYEDKTVEDSSMYKGESKIETNGVDGKKSVDAEVVAVNGVVVDTIVLNETTLTEPVARVTKVGTMEKPKYVGTAKFMFPTAGTVTSRFGSRWGRNHNGMDIANSTGTLIKASDNGIVTFAGTKSGYGLIVIIDHQNGYETYYGHCSKLAVKQGDKVLKGDVIAYMGSTGNSTGSHLHFEIRKNGTPLNPGNFVN